MSISYGIEDHVAIISFDDGKANVFTHEVLDQLGEALDRAVDAVLEAFAGGPFIFNLGHGILPETPIAHVERMLARVRGQ